MGGTSELWVPTQNDRPLCCCGNLYKLYNPHEPVSTSANWGKWWHLLTELLYEGYITTVHSKSLDFVIVVIITCSSKLNALLFSILSTGIHVQFQVLGKNLAFVHATQEGYLFIYLILDFFFFFRKGYLFLIIAYQEPQDHQEPPRSLSKGTWFFSVLRY